MGTARARRFCEDMIARDCYQLDRLAKQLDTTADALATRAMRIDRVVVAKEFRRTGLAGRMVTAIEQASVADGVDLVGGHRADERGLATSRRKIRVGTVS